jgi:hypothetical protein
MSASADGAGAGMPRLAAATPYPRPGFETPARRNHGPDQRLSGRLHAGGIPPTQASSL